MDRILVIEYDPKVQRAMSRLFEPEGFVVEIAGTGEAGLQAFAARQPNVVILDLRMPGMGGRELAREIAGVKPQTRVLYMSGYAVSAIVHHGVLEANTFFLAKPLTPASLLLKVRQVLDKPRECGSSETQGQHKNQIGICFDLAVGDDNIFGADRYRTSLRFTVVNLTNKVALYNFLSTFSGTHFVTPRTFTGELGFHF